jgi:hypothetical protein
MLALAARVAVALGDGWTALRFGDPPFGNPGAALLQHADGRELFMLELTYPFSQRGRVEISGVYPERYWPRSTCEIRVAPTRPAAAIAGDIRRRLLPRYEPLLAEARRKVAALNADKAERERVAAAIMAAVPGTVVGNVQPRSQGISLRLPHDGWRREVAVSTGVGGTQVSIELCNLDPATAVAMLSALGDCLAGPVAGGKPAAASTGPAGAVPVRRGRRIGGRLPRLRRGPRTGHGATTAGQLWLQGGLPALSG